MRVSHQLGKLTDDVEKTRRLTFVILLLVTLTIFIPIKTRMIPKWRLQVVDVNGVACPKMRVTESWGHYRLYLDGNDSIDDRLTDLNGYVEFPERFTRASLSRRIVMPMVTRVTTLMHGGWNIDGAVWGSGIKDVAWLQYKSDKPMPDRLRVEKCISEGTEQALTQALQLDF